MFADKSISRVHLLVIEIDGALYAIDTASKNGTWQGGLPVRSARLVPGAVLRLARHATVEWRPLH
jgi:pSer/pThr/pTyr-binding forkhead associated (FHA) protein